MSQYLSSAAVVIGALRVNRSVLRNIIVAAVCYKKALHKAEWQLLSWLEENAFCETNYCIDYKNLS